MWKNVGKSRGIIETKFHVVSRKVAGALGGKSAATPQKKPPVEKCSFITVRYLQFTNDFNSHVLISRSFLRGLWLLSKRPCNFHIFACKFYETFFIKKLRFSEHLEPAIAGRCSAWCSSFKLRKSRWVDVQSQTLKGKGKLAPFKTRPRCPPQ